MFLINRVEKYTACIVPFVLYHKTPNTVADALHNQLIIWHQCAWLHMCCCRLYAGYYTSMYA